MRILKNYNDFLEEKLLESVDHNDIQFILSDRLLELLKSINHPIAKELVHSHLYVKEKKSITLLDYDDNNIDYFTYVISDKLHEYILKNFLKKSYNIETLSKRKPELWKYNRVSSSIGKIINKLFPNKFQNSGDPGKDIESFINQIKLKRTYDFTNFDIVSGNDIIKYYDSDSYQSNAGTSKLGNSCMKFKICGDYLKFFVINGVKLLILYSEEEKDKIKGRALLWDVKYINHKKVNDIIFMDNIYTIYDHDTLLFIEYAKKKGWLYKKNQDVFPDTPVIDPKGRFDNIYVMSTKHNIKDNYSYPYADTFKNYYFSETGKGSYLASGEPVYKEGYELRFLESNHGEYILISEDDNLVWVKLYNKLLPKDELVWCDFGEDWRKKEDAIKIANRIDYATKQYIDSSENDHIILSKLENAYIDINYDNFEQLKYYNDYVTEEYARENLVYSDYEDTFLKKSDVVWSNYHDCFIYKDNSIEVITRKGKDFRVIGDKSYYELNGKYYDKNVKK